MLNLLFFIDMNTFKKLTNLQHCKQINLLSRVQFHRFLPSFSHGHIEAKQHSAANVLAGAKLHNLARLLPDKPSLSV